MLSHAREAVAFAANRERADLDIDRLLNLGLVRLLEVVGEAASQVPQADRARYPQIPWLGIIRLRHRIVHGYTTINFDILWQIIHTDLPPLIAQREAILAGQP
ncbi:MAG: DUF86 domain-containing protein [Armatimonadetes bacterium]|nr:DUF86 domain-containing protein [Armatimonadota bacterium]